jgi:dienelactone hydrolase
VKTQTIAHTVGSDAFDTHVARPDGDGPHPTVLVFHAWGGRSDFDHDRAKRLAELGYIGAAVDLYGVGKRGTDNASSEALMMPLVGNPTLLRARIRAAYDAVRALDGVDADKMGSIGFCFGGLCSLLAARLGLALRGVVSFHGLLKLGEPIDANVQARMLIEHGQDDPMVSAADIAAWAEEMKRIDADWTLHAYPGVKHSFTNPNATDPSSGMFYDAYADARSWLEMTRFFEDVLR